MPIAPQERPIQLSTISSGFSHSYAVAVAGPELIADRTGIEPASLTRKRLPALPVLTRVHSGSLPSVRGLGASGSQSLS